MINELYVILYRIVMVMYSILRISADGDILNERTSIIIDLNDLQKEIREKAFYDYD